MYKNKDDARGVWRWGLDLTDYCVAVLESLHGLFDGWGGKDLHLQL